MFIVFVPCFGMQEEVSDKRKRLDQNEHGDNKRRRTDFNLKSTADLFSAINRLAGRDFAGNPLALTNIQSCLIALEKKAKDGDAEAQNVLGGFYENGLQVVSELEPQVKQNFAKAMEWYSLAAAQGHEAARLRFEACSPRRNAQLISQIPEGIWKEIFTSAHNAIDWREEKGRRCYTRENSQHNLEEIDFEKDEAGWPIDWEAYVNATSIPRETVFAEPPQFICKAFNDIFNRFVYGVDVCGLDANVVQFANSLPNCQRVRITKFCAGHAKFLEDLKIKNEIIIDFGFKSQNQRDARDKFEAARVLKTFLEKNELTDKVTIIFNSHDDTLSQFTCTQTSDALKMNCALQNLGLINCNGFAASHVAVALISNDRLQCLRMHADEIDYQSTVKINPPDDTPYLRRPRSLTKDGHNYEVAFDIVCGKDEKHYWDAQRNVNELSANVGITEGNGIILHNRVAHTDDRLCNGISVNIYKNSLSPEELAMFGINVDAVEALTGNSAEKISLSLANPVMALFKFESENYKIRQHHKRIIESAINAVVSFSEIFNGNGVLKVLDVGMQRMIIGFTETLADGGKKVYCEREIFKAFDITEEESEKYFAAISTLKTRGVVVQ